MVSGHHIRLIQVSNFLDLNIYAKTPWGPIVIETNKNSKSKNYKTINKIIAITINTKTEAKTPVYSRARQFKLPGRLDLALLTQASEA